MDINDITPVRETPNMSTIAPFKHLLQPASTLDGKVYVTVNWDGTRLSLTGVEGPKANGDAKGGCGQIVSVLSERELKVSPGWNREAIAKLAEVWDRWHLNDARAGCEHQRAEKWSERPIDPSKPLEDWIHFEGQDLASRNMLVWVRPDEHPEGLLTAPCETCGYRYGTAWLTEEVPEDVLKWLSELPQADVEKYPWTF